MSLGISRVSKIASKILNKLPEFNTVEIAKVVWYILNQVNFFHSDTTAN